MRQGLALVGRPPHEPPADTLIAQLCASLAANLHHAPSHPLLLVPSTAAAATRLRQLAAAHAPSLRPTVVSLPHALRLVSPRSSVDLDRLPEALRQRMHAARPAWGGKLHVRDVGRYTSLHRAIHQAVAVRYATRVLGCEVVLLLRPESYLWRRVGLAALVRTRGDVFYSDHRGAAPSFPESPPLPDTLARSRQFCSIHAWYGGGGRATGAASSSWRQHAPRFAIGRDWAMWENLTRQAHLLPAPDADLAADPLLVFDAAAFGAYWRAVERAWGGRPLADALLDAMVARGSLWKHCLRGDVFFLELSYRSFLYHHFEPNGSVRFHNATRLIRHAFPPAARPLGHAYPPAPRGFGQRWFHAAPAGVSRLWYHFGSNGSESGIEAFYRTSPRPAFRYDFSEFHEGGAQGGAARSIREDCEVLRLIARLPDASAASLQVDSLSPGEALRNACATLLDTRLRIPPVPWVPGQRSSPAFWRHRWEWFPD
ncbi:hypothetical protein AB1Y20_005917 [Prymnesium parvum]|uniref:Protein xylosyltransferase n=1 Tax=Prymnesium parvum TaxID=97485 RepID=A0AB34J2L0_PRYPA